VAGSDLGEVGIDLGRPIMCDGSMLEVLARDCDVLDRLKSALWCPGTPALLPRPLKSPNSAPGVRDIDLWRKNN
jgi:hypothetical protein